MTSHLSRRYAAIVVATSLAGCSTPSPQMHAAELLVLPSSYVVDGRHFSAAADAVDAVLAKPSTSLAIPACGAMATQRVVEITELLRTKYQGAIAMSVLGSGERGCPGYSS